MDDLASAEASAFNPEGEVEPICMRSIDAILKDQHYEEGKVALWTNYICEDIMQGLAQLGKPFKYIVNCVIFQNTGAPMQIGLSEFSDTFNDGVCLARWPTEKAKDTTNIACIVTVFGVALYTSEG